MRNQSVERHETLTVDLRAVMLFPVDLVVDKGFPSIKYKIACLDRDELCWTQDQNEILIYIAAHRINMKSVKEGSFPVHRILGPIIRKIKVRKLKSADTITHNFMNFDDLRTKILSQMFTKNTVLLWDLHTQ